MFFNILNRILSYTIVFLFLSIRVKLLLLFPILDTIILTKSYAYLLTQIKEILCIIKNNVHFIIFVTFNG